MIRPMGKEDIFQVIAIEKQTFSEPWSRDGFLQTMEKDENIYLVWDWDGDVIGYCGLWGVLEEGQITNVAVGDSYRRKGIGTSLLKHLIAAGREAGLTAFTLEVRESNESAIRLYEKLGFQKAGIRKKFYRQPEENAFIMWLND